MNYKYLTATTLAKIDDDGIARSSCSIENDGFKAWLLAGNTPLPADAPTPEQLAAQAEADAIKALKVETKANAAFDALKAADFTTINTFINTHFATTDAQGRAMLKVMAAAAGAYLRENS